MNTYGVLRAFSVLAVIFAGLFAGVASAAPNEANIVPQTVAQSSPFCLATLPPQFGNRAPAGVAEARALCDPLKYPELAARQNIIPLTGVPSASALCPANLQQKFGDRAPASLADALACNPVQPIMVP